MSLLEKLGLKQGKSKKKPGYKKLPPGTHRGMGRRYEGKKEEPGFLDTVTKQFTERDNLFSGTKEYNKGGLVTDYRKTGMTKSTVDNLKKKKKK